MNIKLIKYQCEKVASQTIQMTGSRPHITVILIFDQPVGSVDGIPQHTYYPGTSKIRDFKPPTLMLWREATTY